MKFKKVNDHSVPSSLISICVTILTLKKFRQCCLGSMGLKSTTYQCLMNEYYNNL